MLRWAADDFDRPWRCRNPADLALLAQHLQRGGLGRRLVVALEPTGTYGDALRQALGQAGLIPHRVSPKAAAADAEAFDGVPSQHDGKDAAVVAELAAQGRSWLWPRALPVAPDVPGGPEGPDGPCGPDGPEGPARPDGPEPPAGPEAPATP